MKDDNKNVINSCPVLYLKDGDACLFVGTQRIELSDQRSDPMVRAKIEKITLQRKNLNARLAPPKLWSRVADPMVAERITLFDGAEKKKVVDAFLSSLSRTRITVVSVERIQNLALWQNYSMKRETVLQREKSMAADARFERIWLFHGTDEMTVPKIIQQGFNRSFCGRNATRYGKGVCECRYKIAPSHAQLSSGRALTRRVVLLTPAVVRCCAAQTLPVIQATPRRRHTQGPTRLASSTCLSAG